MPLYIQAGQIKTLQQKWQSERAKEQYNHVMIQNTVFIMNYTFTSTLYTVIKTHHFQAILHTGIMRSMLMLLLLSQKFTILMLLRN